MICIDPKGENARIAGRARQTFGPVHVLDPFGITGRPSAAFNPLDALDPDGLDVAEDTSTLADALVYDEPGTAGEAHWNEEAKALIAGVILHVVASEPRDRRTLATLRENLTLAPDAFAALLKAMQASTAAGGLVARAANRHLGKSDREAAGVLSAAQRHTHFLDSPRMTAVLGRSDFRFADLKARTTTVFLVLPPDRLATLAEFERDLIRERTMAGLAAARARGRKGGRKFALTKAQVRLAQAAMAQRDTSVSNLCKELGIERVTLYRYVGPNGELRNYGKRVLGLA